MSDAKTVRDTSVPEAAWSALYETNATGGDYPAIETDRQIAALHAAGYRITPAVRDDGARVRAMEEAAQICVAREMHYAGMLSSGSEITVGEAYRLAMRAFRSVAAEIRALAAADAVAGAGRDGDAP